MRTQLIIIMFAFSVYSLLSQCNPKLNYVIPEGYEVLKTIDISMKVGRDSITHQQFMLRDNSEYMFLMVEEDEYLNKAFFRLFNNGKLIGTNYNPDNKKFSPSISFKCNEICTYNINIHKINKENYCGLLLLLQKKADENKNIEKDISSKSNTYDPDIYVIVEKMPKFKDGKMDDAFKQWINENLIYPEEAKNKGISGRVYVNFIVDYEGYVRDVKIAKGVNPILDVCALELIKKSPRWQSPGIQRGAPRNIKFTFPVDFKLSE